MPTIFEAAKTFRKSLAARETATAREMLNLYHVAVKRLDKDFIALAAEIKEKGIIAPSDALRLERFKKLRASIAAEMQKITSGGTKLCTAAQSVNAAAGKANAADLIEIGANVGAKLPTKTLETFAGFAGDGSPLKDLFESINKGAPEKVKNTLIESIALGRTPQQTAAELRKSFGTSAARALTISRTESLRAYKIATLEVYRENSDIVRGWRWVAAKSFRTCLSCLARDGSIWKLKKPMPSHPNCRCLLIPVMINEKEKSPETGAQWFEKQESGVKRQMLGKAAFVEYEKGKVGLNDFAGLKKSAQWGETAYTRSLKEVLELDLGNR